MSLLRDSDIMVSHPLGVCETLEKMGAMAVLADSIFDTSFGFMVYCLFATSIGRRVRLHGFPTNSRWVRCQMFRCRLHLQHFVVMQTGLGGAVRGSSDGGFDAYAAYIKGEGGWNLSI